MFEAESLSTCLLATECVKVELFTMISEPAIASRKAS